MTKTAQIKTITLGIAHVSTNLNLQFHWLHNDAGDDCGLIAIGDYSSEHNPSQGLDFSAYIYEKSEQEFLKKYPTIEDLLLAFSKNALWKNSSISFIDVSNNCDLYNSFYQFVSFLSTHPHFDNVSG